MELAVAAHRLELMDLDTACTKVLSQVCHFEYFDLSDETNFNGFRFGVGIATASDQSRWRFWLRCKLRACPTGRTNMTYLTV